MRKAITAAILSAFITAPAFAVDYGPTAGSREFTLAGAGTSDKNFDNSAIGVSGSYGWYLSRHTAVNLRQSWSYADVPGDNTWLASTRVGVDYHFGDSRLRPFIGVNLGLVYGEDVDTTGIAGPEIGLKYYAKPETFIFIQSEYQFFFEDTNDVENNYDDGAFVHTIGIGFNF